MSGFLGCASVVCPRAAAAGRPHLREEAAATGPPAMDHGVPSRLALSAPCQRPPIKSLSHPGRSMLKLTHRMVRSRLAVTNRPIPARGGCGSSAGQSTERYVGLACRSRCRPSPIARPPRACQSVHSGRWIALSVIGDECVVWCGLLVPGGYVDASQQSVAHLRVT